MANDDLTINLDLIADDAVPGLHVGRVTEWLERNVTGAKGPFRWEVIAGGHSNLTYRVQGANGERYVLRRPPMGQVLASAHDMSRENRIISALGHSAVPVPPVLGMCHDTSVTGAPFYVMGFVDGHVLRDEVTARTTLDATARAAASQSLVDTLASIHAVDLDAVGLSDLGRHEGYIARQLKRWYGQWNSQKTRELPSIDRVHDALATMIPEQGPATIVHGDYRLDNCMVDSSGAVVAVLDWEICTLGDPLADLGLLMVYWTGPNDDGSAWAGRSTAVEGFWDRQQLADRYAEVSGRDLSQLDVYVAFAFWKLACILEGVYARYLHGALGDRDPEELREFKDQVDAAALMAEQTLERLR
jgi:aminoglycoside phosphotransferase (APT) family kinase protein